MNVNCAGYHRSRSTAPAAKYLLRAKDAAPSAPGRPLCGFHAAHERKGYSVIQGFSLLLPLTPELAGPFLREQEAAARAERAREDAQRAERGRLHAERVNRAWEELPTPYTATLVVEEDGFSRTPAHTAAIAIHPVGQDRRSHTEAVVALRVDRDGPVYVEVRGSSVLSPAAAVVLAEVLPVVAGWADEANALPFPEGGDA